MAKDYLIQLKDSSRVLVTGTTLKVGKGKKACEVVGVRKYGSGMEFWYCVDHLPSCSLVAGGFIYQAIARHVAQVLVDVIGDTLRDPADAVATAIEGPMEDFISYMQRPNIQEALNDTKRSKGLLPTLEDFINGPYYETLLRERDNRAVFKQQTAQYYEELLAGDRSLGWVSSSDGTGLDGSELGALIEGRRTPSEVVSYSPTGKRTQFLDD